MRQRLTRQRTVKVRIIEPVGRLWPGEIFETEPGGAEWLVVREYAEYIDTDDETKAKL